jgi:hypothetical protein
MQRPTSVTVFGILNIVFAGFGILAVGATIIMLVVASPESANPTMQLIENNPAYSMWLKFSIPLGIAAVAVLLTSGIGLLKLKSWARTLSIIYAIYALIQLFITTGVNYIYLFQPMMEKARNEGGPAASAAMGGAIGGMCGSCVGIIYPVLLLIFMMRSNVAAAFESSNASQPPEPPQVSQ